MTHKQDSNFLPRMIYLFLGQFMFSKQKKIIIIIEMDRLQPKFITFKLISDIVWQAASSNTADLKSSYTDVVTTVIYSNRKGSWVSRVCH